MNIIKSTLDNRDRAIVSDMGPDAILYLLSNTPNTNGHKDLALSLNTLDEYLFGNVAISTVDNADYLHIVKNNGERRSLTIDKLVKVIIGDEDYTHILSQDDDMGIWKHPANAGDPQERIKMNLRGLANHILGNPEQKIVNTAMSLTNDVAVVTDEDNGIRKLITVDEFDKFLSDTANNAKTWYNFEPSSANLSNLQLSYRKIVADDNGIRLYRVIDNSGTLEWDTNSIMGINIESDSSIHGRLDDLVLKPYGIGNDINYIRMINNEITIMNDGNSNYGAKYAIDQYRISYTNGSNDNYYEVIKTADNVVVNTLHDNTVPGEYYFNWKYSWNGGESDSLVLDHNGLRIPGINTSRIIQVGENVEDSILSFVANNDIRTIENDSDGNAIFIGSLKPNELLIKSDPHGNGDTYVNHVKLYGNTVEVYGGMGDGCGNHHDSKLRIIHTSRDGSCKNVTYFQMDDGSNRGDTSYFKWYYNSVNVLQLSGRGDISIRKSMTISNNDDSKPMWYGVSILNSRYLDNYLNTTSDSIDYTAFEYRYFLKELHYGGTIHIVTMSKDGLLLPGTNTTKSFQVGDAVADSNYSILRNTAVNIITNNSSNNVLTQSWLMSDKMMIQSGPLSSTITKETIVFDNSDTDSKYEIYHSIDNGRAEISHNLTLADANRYGYMWWTWNTKLGTGNNATMMKLNYRGDLWTNRSIGTHDMYMSSAGYGEIPKGFYMDHTGTFTMGYFNNGSYGTSNVYTKIRSNDSIIFYMYGTSMVKYMKSTTDGLHIFSDYDLNGSVKGEAYLGTRRLSVSDRDKHSAYIDALEGVSIIGSENDPSSIIIYTKDGNTVISKGELTSESIQLSKPDDSRSIKLDIATGLYIRGASNYANFYRADNDDVNNHGFIFEIGDDIGLVDGNRNNFEWRESTGDRSNFHTMMNLNNTRLLMPGDNTDKYIQIGNDTNGYSYSRLTRDELSLVSLDGGGGESLSSKLNLSSLHIKDTNNHYINLSIDGGLRIQGEGYNYFKIYRENNSLSTSYNGIFELGDDNVGTFIWRISNWDGTFADVLTVSRSSLISINGLVAPSGKFVTGTESVYIDRNSISITNTSAPHKKLYIELNESTNDANFVVNTDDDTTGSFVWYKNAASISGNRLMTLTNGGALDVATSITTSGGTIVIGPSGMIFSGDNTPKTIRIGNAVADGVYSSLSNGGLTTTKNTANNNLLNHTLLTDSYLYVASFTNEGATEYVTRLTSQQLSFVSNNSDSYVDIIKSTSEAKLTFRATNGLNGGKFVWESVSNGGTNQVMDIDRDGKLSVLNKVGVYTAADSVDFTTNRLYIDNVTGGIHRTATLEYDKLTFNQGFNRFGVIEAGTSGGLEFTGWDEQTGTPIMDWKLGDTAGSATSVMTLNKSGRLSVSNHIKVGGVLIGDMASGDRKSGIALDQTQMIQMGLLTGDPAVYNGSWTYTEIVHGELKLFNRDSSNVIQYSNTINHQSIQMDYESYGRLNITMDSDYNAYFNIGKDVNNIGSFVFRKYDGTNYSELMRLSRSSSLTGLRVLEVGANINAGDPAAIDGSKVRLAWTGIDVYYEDTNASGTTPHHAHGGYGAYELVLNPNYSVSSNGEFKLTTHGTGSDDNNKFYIDFIGMRVDGSGVYNHNTVFNWKSGSDNNAIFATLDKTGLVFPSNERMLIGTITSSVTYSQYNNDTIQVVANDSNSNWISRSYMQSDRIVVDSKISGYEEIVEIGRNLIHIENKSTSNKRFAEFTQYGFHSTNDSGGRFSVYNNQSSQGAHATFELYTAAGVSASAIGNYRWVSQFDGGNQMVLMELDHNSGLSKLRTLEVAADVSAGDPGTINGSKVNLAWTGLQITYEDTGANPPTTDQPKHGIGNYGAYEFILNPNATVASNGTFRLLAKGTGADDSNKFYVNFIGMRTNGTAVTNHNTVFVWKSGNDNANVFATLDKTGMMIHSGELTFNNLTSGRDTDSYSRYTPTGNRILDSGGFADYDSSLTSDSYEFSGHNHRHAHVTFKVRGLYDPFDDDVTDVDYTWMYNSTILMRYSSIDGLWISGDKFNTKISGFGNATLNRSANFNIIADSASYANYVWKLNGDVKMELYTDKLILPGDNTSRIIQIGSIGSDNNYSTIGTAGFTIQHYSDYGYGDIKRQIVSLDYNSLRFTEVNTPNNYYVISRNAFDGSVKHTLNGDSNSIEWGFSNVKWMKLDNQGTSNNSALYMYNTVDTNKVSKFESDRYYMKDLNYKLVASKTGNWLTYEILTENDSDHKSGYMWNSFDDNLMYLKYDGVTTGGISVSRIDNSSISLGDCTTKTLLRVKGCVQSNNVLVEKGVALVGDTYDIWNMDSLAQERMLMSIPLDGSIRGSSSAIALPAWLFAYFELNIITFTSNREYMYAVSYPITRGVGSATNAELANSSVVDVVANGFNKRGNASAPGISIQFLDNNNDNLNVIVTSSSALSSVGGSLYVYITLTNIVRDINQ